MSDTEASVGITQWVEIRGAGKLLCRIDPPRCLLEIVDRRVETKIDLAAYGLVFDEGVKAGNESDLT